MLDDFESRMEARDIVRRSFECVCERDQELLVARWVYGVPQRDLAEEHGVTIGRIRQLEARGLRKARRWLDNKLKPGVETLDKWRFHHALPYVPPVDRKIRPAPSLLSFAVLVGEDPDIMAQLRLWREAVNASLCPICPILERLCCVPVSQNNTNDTRVLHCAGPCKSANPWCQQIHARASAEILAAAARLGPVSVRSFGSCHAALRH